MNRAENFLLRRFAEVASDPTPDLGTDLSASRLYAVAGTHTFRIQVKTGESYCKAGFEIPATTLQLWLTTIETEPLVIFHYHSAETDAATPDCFLIFHRYVFPAHLEEVRKSLHSGTPFKIAHADCQPATSEALQEALVHEAQRTRRLGSHPFRTRETPFREDLYIARFAEISALSAWPLLHDSTLRERLVDQGIVTNPECATDLVRNALGLQTGLHPLDAIPSGKLKTKLSQAQTCLYHALQASDQGRSFSLGNDFDVVSILAARAMMAKYPGLLAPVTVVLQNWRHRAIGEVLKALQMAAIAAHEQDTGRAIDVLRNVREDMHDVSASDVASYRLLHETHHAMAHATGERGASAAAVALAKRFFPYEAQHLQRYGWGLGSHVVVLYESAAGRRTTSGEKLKDYNLGMAAVVSDALGDLRRVGCVLP